MAGRYTALLLLTAVFFCGSALSPAVYAQGAGTHVVLKNYVLPQYRNSDNRLQFIIYGTEATNKGAMLNLADVMVDIMDNSVKNLDQVTLFKFRTDSNTQDAHGPFLPEPYSLTAPKSVVSEFWSNPQNRHTCAWIFSGKATYDKSTQILRSDEPAQFRYQALDANGDGYDAYPLRKFIHIRKNVKVVIRPEMRRSVEPGKDSKKK